MPRFPRLPSAFPLLVRSSRLALVFTPALMLLSAGARAQAPLSETDSLYIGNRVTLSVSTPRQLTVAARIENFAWSPDGRRIAYLTRSEDGQDSAVVMIRPDDGRSRVYDRGHLDASGDETNTEGSTVERLAGWSSDGNHFAFVVDTTDPSGSPLPLLKVVDLANGITNTVSFPFDTKRAHWSFDLPDFAWAPKRDLMAFTARIMVQQANTVNLVEQKHVLIYDAQTHMTKDLLPVAPGVQLLGWANDDHVLATIPGDKASVTVSADATTGAITPATRKDAVQAQQYLPDYLTSRLETGAAGEVTLSLLGGPEDNVLEDVKDHAGKRHGGVVHLWVSVTSDKPAPSVFKKPTVLPQLLVDSFRSPADPSAVIIQLAPRQGLPSRARVAYLIGGDLYMADITPRTPSVQELIAAGEPLTCPEEQRLAVSDAKQLGLAVIQYTQDYDEHYPPAGNFHDEVYPYIKSEEVFQVGDHDFQFSLDGNTMASLDDPAHTEMGDFDLPCGRVVAYADGSVKVLKPGE